MYMAIADAVFRRQSPRLDSLRALIGDDLYVRMTQAYRNYLTARGIRTVEDAGYDLNANVAGGQGYIDAERQEDLFFPLRAPDARDEDENPPAATGAQRRQRASNIEDARLAVLPIYEEISALIVARDQLRQQSRVRMDADEYPTASSSSAPFRATVRPRDDEALPDEEPEQEERRVLQRSHSPAPPLAAGPSVPGSSNVVQQED